jgi:methyl-accepting chemotaxis protein
MWFRNLKIGAKLGLGFGACLFMAALTGFIAQRGFGAVESNLTHLEEDSYGGYVVISGVGDQVSLARIKQYRLAGTPDKALRKSLDGLIDEHRKNVEKGLTDYEATAFMAEDKANHAALKKAWSNYDGYYEQIKSKLLNEEANAETFDKFDKASSKIYLEELVPAVDKVNAYNKKNADAAIKDTHRTIASGGKLALTFLGIALGVGILMAWFIATSIKNPVRELSSRLESLSQNCLTNLCTAIGKMENGDLTIEVVPVTKPILNPAKDEVGRMSADFNAMLDMAQTTIGAYERTRMNLSKLMGTIKQNAGSVASTSVQLDQAAAETGQAATSIANTMQQVAMASDEAARSSGQIASGAEQLAQSATQAANAMERLQGFIGDVQQGSARQATATKDASDTATAVSKAVENTVASMDRIQVQVQASSVAVSELGEKGQQIGAIVQTIEDIAQQTNLLALNAAIEAARAGEQGKGFAVVADEVRKLAERSASATQEIATLIESVRSGVEQAVNSMEASNKEVLQGASSSSEAGEAIKQILEAVKTVSSIAKDNAKAIEEMESGAKVVTDAISAAAAVSEETAAGAEEMSASTEEVSASAQTVSAAVEEQTAQIEEVGASAQSLSRLAEDLNELVAQFKVNEKQKDVQLRVAA